jgi:histidyl-tRNA synthetase
MKEAPLIDEFLCDACRKHFEAVQALLVDVGVTFQLEPRLVRGLDYYTRTAFEYVGGELGAQNAVGGGGRYDGLSEALGGPPLPAIGFALGVDRIVLSAGERALARGPAVSVYAVALSEEAARISFRLVTELRAAGIGAELDLAGRSMKGQLKDAARSGARIATIIGDDEVAAGEVALKRLDSAEQRNVPIGEVVPAVRAELDASAR